MCGYLAREEIELFVRDEGERVEALHERGMLTIIMVALIDGLLIEGEARIIEDRSKIFGLLPCGVDIEALVARDPCLFIRDEEREERAAKKKEREEEGTHDLSLPLAGLNHSAPADIAILPARRIVRASVDLDAELAALSFKGCGIDAELREAFAIMMPHPPDLGSTEANDEIIGRALSLALELCVDACAD